MKRDRLNNELQTLERKIRLLMNQYSQEKKNSEDLQNEISELKSLITSKEQQIQMGKEIGVERLGEHNLAFKLG